ncbi:hypothetical protein ORI20_31430 [Mycobacterium sp. CVI_P3]|uniref:Uncharacterized protein n=1 Tax=Mycobacterium pinniadriaticum TaxID=2994102 RepID=A0ABT3SNY0_9MYCO|nr:hypothetical protein [Mycobacterium pinniadriaticum]MCX2934780.1 hypothetical protein [Mycobacterium pinniadriaticum]MCX2941221.1 hypothetical protein [Mycobacterium pinniadriaticum]
MQHVFGWTALIAFAAGTILSMFPLWKSATLSPDSIKRRVWWTGCAIVTVSLFWSQLPYWQGGLFVSVMTALGLFAVAGFWANFIKINRRIYGAFAYDRPDRPPTLAPQETE